jgi:cation diffusion facilitator CzcD-associated flavoprotein CzcO
MFNDEHIHSRGGRKPRRIAVIGAGPAGLAAARFVAEQGLQPTIFERGRYFGGIWASEPTNPVVYQDLVTNIPKVCMQSFDLDFPSDLPSYIRGADLGRYICSYAEKFGLPFFTKFNASVTKVHHLKEEEKGTKSAEWRVTWIETTRADGEGVEAGTKKIERTKDFDGVVVATGHYEVPYEPEVPGQVEWLAASPSQGSRTVMHSKDYNEPSSFAARNVLVVGGRSSAVDVARELRGVASWVYVI